jgi:hypothetical protein
MAAHQCPIVIDNAVEVVTLRPVLTLDMRLQVQIAKRKGHLSSRGQCISKGQVAAEVLEAWIKELSGDDDLAQLMCSIQSTVTTYLVIQLVAKENVSPGEALQVYDKLLWSPPHSQRLGRLFVFLALRTVPRLLFSQLLRLGEIVKGILKPQAFGMLLSGLWSKMK